MGRFGRCSVAPRRRRAPLDHGRCQQEPIQLSGVYDRNRLLEESDPVGKASALANRRQAVDADGTPLPLVETRLFVGDSSGHSSLDEIEPKGDPQGSSRGHSLTSTDAARAIRSSTLVTAAAEAADDLTC